VNVGTERRSITITVLVWESNTCTCVARVLDTNTVKAIRVGGVQRRVGVCSRADPLDRLGGSIRVVNDALAAGSRGRSEFRVADNHMKSGREWLDGIGGSFEAGNH
jgi:hypothetical protein